MKIGIDATWWSNWRGFGRFTRSLVNAMIAIDSSNEYVLFFDSGYHRCADLPRNAAHKIVPTARPQEDAIGPDSRRTAADILKMTLAASRAALDVFFSPSIDGYFPVFNVPCRIVAIHDANIEEMPGLVVPGVRARMFRQIKVRFAVRQADLLVTVSSYSRAQISEVLGVPVEKIGIIPGGADSIFHPAESFAESQAAARSRYSAGAPYFLYVGGAGPTKNLGALAAAFTEIVASHDSVRLLLAGKPDPKGELPAIAARFGERARFLGFQPDAVLAELYRGAEAVIVPSLKEGVGLPGIEAVACGTPAIVTMTSPLPELLGDAAIAIDPARPAEIAAAMKALLENHDLRQSKRAAARRLSGAFRWDNSARAALDLFGRVAAEKRRRLAAR
jgi:glycosyltransferase involved in cell wall biosynthesis